MEIPQLGAPSSLAFDARRGVFGAGFQEPDPRIDDGRDLTVFFGQRAQRGQWH